MCRCVAAGLPDTALASMVPPVGGRTIAERMTLLKGLHSGVQQDARRGGQGTEPHCTVLTGGLGQNGRHHGTSFQKRRFKCLMAQGNWAPSLAALLASYGAHGPRGPLWSDVGRWRRIRTARCALSNLCRNCGRGCGGKAVAAS